MPNQQLAAWFQDKQQQIEVHYLESDSPYQHSGWSSTPDRFRLAREIIFHAVPGDGTFLDIGCANGLLLESLMQWTGEREVQLTPYGIGVSEKLIDLARSRLPAFASNFAVANGFYFQPKERFSHVHTLLEFVPDDLHPEYLKRLLTDVVAPGGRLIVSSYSSRSRNIKPINVAAYLQKLGLHVAGCAEAIEADGWALTRVAWVDQG